MAALGAPQSRNSTQLTPNCTSPTTYLQAETRSAARWTHSSLACLPRSYLPRMELPSVITALDGYVGEQGRRAGLPRAPARTLPKSRRAGSSPCTSFSIPNRAERFAFPYSAQRKEAPMTASKTGLDALLTPESSVLVLIDHQPF